MSLIISDLRGGRGSPAQVPVNQRLTTALCKHESCQPRAKYENKLLVNFRPAATILAWLTTKHSAPPARFAPPSPRNPMPAPTAASARLARLALRPSLASRKASAASAARRSRSNTSAPFRSIRARRFRADTITTRAPSAATRTPSPTGADIMSARTHAAGKHFSCHS